VSLVQLFREEGSIQPGRVAFMSGVAGLSSAGVLAIINAAADAVEQRQPTTTFFFAFVAIVVLYVISKRFIMLTAIRETEQIVHKIRVRIVDHVMRSDLLALEKIGRGNIFASAGKETRTISQAAFLLTNAAESLAMLVFAVLYLAYLSMAAFVIGAVFVTLAVVIHFRKTRTIDAELRDAINQENTCLDDLNDFLAGFKETKVNAARAADMFRNFQRQSSLAAEKQTTTQSRMAEHFTLTQVMFYLLIATMVFVVPIFSEAFGNVVVKTATAVLFMIGAITTIVTTVPIVVQANAAAGNVRAIEQQLVQTARGPQTQALAEQEPVRAFQEIVFENVIFEHRDAHDNASFSLGPLNLTLRAGETVFITGGNGSGKTTLMRLLIGLYRPTTGVIKVDGKIVDEKAIDAYRNMFGVVFSDFHLFKRLYGMMEAAQDKIDALLAKLEIQDKTRVVNGVFDTLDLSGGQRKRVALVVAMLEDRPAIVLDEWAADQDPVFRKKFYEEMLVELKRKGKTIIAITHDDHYFHVADRQIRMEYGQVAADIRGQSHA
jgi:putative pyoverdin transport system ATP-binding/permease protein